MFSIQLKGDDAGEEYAKDVAEVISNREAKISAYIAESILSCAGQILLPPGYLKVSWFFCLHAQLKLLLRPFTKIAGRTECLQ